MSDLAGKLTTIGLAEVFQNIAFNQHTGTLTLKQGERKARVAFENGRIRAVNVADRELDYIDIARRCGLASEEVLEKAASANLRRTLKAYLQASGGLDEQLYDRTIASCVEEELLPLFGWKAASFDFEEGRVKRVFDKEQLGAQVDLDPTGVAMEAARRHDEWESIEGYVPTDRDVLVPAANLEFEFSPEAERLLPLLDGTRTFAEVVQEAPLKAFDVQKTVAGLVEVGALVPATPERMLNLAIVARTAGKVTLAARRLEVALQLDPDNLDPRFELVRLYERAGQKNDASRELVHLAELQAERGDSEGAVESYERATVLAPGDLDILERILSLYEARGDNARALKIGRRLAEALVAQEMCEDALPLYERLIQVSDGNLELHESMANCLLKLDETGEAAKHLLVPAAAAFERGDFRTARRYYERILSFDEANAEACQRLEEIKSGEAENRIARARRRRYLTIASLVGVLFLAQVVREWYAVGVIQAAQDSALASLARDNGDNMRLEVIRACTEACDAYPFTRAASKARESVHALYGAEIERIEALLKYAALAKDPGEALEGADKLLERVAALSPDEDRWAGKLDQLQKKLSELKRRS